MGNWALPLKGICIGSYLRNIARKTLKRVGDQISTIPPSEGALWVLDQEINDRGYQIDITLAKNADQCVKRAYRQCDEEMQELTNGKISSARCLSTLLEWLKEQENLLDLKESTIESALKRKDLSERARHILQNRLEVSRSAPHKLQTLIDATSKDGRLKGTLQFYGASRTGCWAGRVFQPQNLPRPQSSEEEIEKAIHQ